MSVRSVPSYAPAASTPLPVERLERLAGWGMATSAMSWVYRPSTLEGVVETLALARAHGLSVGLRGAGQSYGDAALNAENLCLDLSRMNRVLGWDPGRGVIRVEPGVTIRQLWQYIVEDGWWPYVVPGTMFASAGGAAAANIHGKNNWKVGPIGDHITEFELLLPSGEVRRCNRDQNAELFHAAIGGFGMLGCFVSLTLQMQRVHSGLLAVAPVSVPTLDAMIGTFEERHARADYLVGWVDCGARGAALGRGLVHEARHLAPDEDRQPGQTLRVQSQELPDTFFGVVPKSIMWRLLKPFTGVTGTRLVNAAKYHGSRWHGDHVFHQSHAAFAFLLDYIPNWKFAYQPGGLIQHQSFIPAPRAAGTFRAMLTLAQRRGVVPYLGVFKRHRPDAFLMTHAVEGYSLALEFKVTAANRQRVWALIAELDPLVLDAGGRFYFAKDSTLSAATAAAFLGEERIREFSTLKGICDPDNLLQTNLYRRLFLA
jgi:FAD/FMN-containing dehydrogenase